MCWTQLGWTQLAQEEMTREQIRDRRHGADGVITCWTALADEVIERRLQLPTHELTRFVALGEFVAVAEAAELGIVQRLVPAERLTMEAKMDANRRAELPERGFGSMGTPRSTIHCPAERRRSCGETGVMFSASHASRSSFRSRCRLPKSFSPFPLACFLA
jgi:enoyl-CoA hydratase/carnithine racemase